MLILTDCNRAKIFIISKILQDLVKISQWSMEKINIFDIFLGPARPVQVLGWRHLVGRHLNVRGRKPPFNYMSYPIDFNFESNNLEFFKTFTLTFCMQN